MSAATKPYFALECEHCGTDLNGKRFTRDDGTTALTRREIGYSAYDRVQFWICPDCNGTWARFAEHDRYYPLAEKLRREYDATGRTSAYPET